MKDKTEQLVLKNRLKIARAEKNMTQDEFVTDDYTRYHDTGFSSSSKQRG